MLTRMLALVLALATTAMADEFDRVEGRRLSEVPKSEGTEVHEAISVQELALLPDVLNDNRDAFVVVKTDQANLARILLLPGYRKAHEEGDEPLPVLVLERFDTFESSRFTTILTSGYDRVLFDGFRIDLDTGQIVPDGQGGDLLFQGGEKPADQTLRAIGGAKIFTMSRSPLSGPTEPGQPSAGREVEMADFSGAFRLVANGQWSGLLTIEVDPEGKVRGRFRSDQTGSSYPIEGRAGDGEPNQIEFTVIFPHSRQLYKGRLFTAGKGAITGTTTLLDRSYGFFALREGGQLSPLGIAVLKNLKGSVVVEIPAEGPYNLDDKPVEGDELLANIRALAGRHPTAPVVLRASPETPYQRVAEVLDRLREGGITNVRLGSPN